MNEDFFAPLSCFVDRSLPILITLSDVTKIRDVFDRIIWLKLQREFLFDGKWEYDEFPEMGKHAWRVTSYLDSIIQYMKENNIQSAGVHFAEYHVRLIVNTLWAVLGNYEDYVEEGKVNFNEFPLTDETMNQLGNVMHHISETATAFEFKDI